MAYQHIQDKGLKGLGNSQSGISAYTGRGAERVREFPEWHISIYRTRGLKGWGIPGVAYQHIHDKGLKGLGNSWSGIPAYT